MKNKTFDIHQWIPARTEREEVEIVLKRIEANHIDLTADYADWCRLGFAFAHAFGEGGRTFCRLSIPVINRRKPTASTTPASSHGARASR